MKAVPNVPTHEEFYGLVDNYLTDDEFTSDNDDEKIRAMILIALSLLQDFYLEHMYYTAFDIVSESFKTELDEFNVELKESLHLLFKDFLDEINAEQTVEWELPSGTVDATVDLENVIDSGVDRVTNTLYLDLKNKADFYRDVAITTGVFSLHANFRRAIKGLSNVIDYNAQYAHRIVKRDYLSFVYGQEALFYWRVTGVNTCPWCYEIEAMGAMPLSWFPVDHPNGGCWLEPVLPDVYSDDYVTARGW